MEIRKPSQQRSVQQKYKAGASTLKVKRVDTKKKQKQKKAFTLWILLVIVLALAVIALLRLNTFFITNVVVTGTKSEKNKIIENEVTNILRGSYVHALPKQNVFIYPEDLIQDTLYKKYTNFDTVTLRRSGLHTLTIMVHERLPVLYVTDQANPTGVFIDSSGYIYNNSDIEYSKLIASSTPVSESTITYVGSTTLALPVDFNNSIGKSIDPAQFKNLLILIDALNKKNIRVISVLLRPYGDAELQITKNGGHIRVHLDDDSLRILANLSAIRKTSPFKEDFLNKRDALQYIDMRFGNKVFYKFTEQNNQKNDTQL